MLQDFRVGPKSRPCKGVRRRSAVEAEAVQCTTSGPTDFVELLAEPFRDLAQLRQILVDHLPHSGLSLRLGCPSPELRLGSFLLRHCEMIVGYRGVRIYSGSLAAPVVLSRLSQDVAY